VFFLGSTAVLASSILVRSRQRTKIILGFLFLWEYGAPALAVVMYWLVIKKF
jgi:hypothetical protein